MELQIYHLFILKSYSGKLKFRLVLPFYIIQLKYVYNWNRYADLENVALIF